MAKRVRKALMFLIDGFDPAYVQPTRMPRLHALMQCELELPELNQRIAADIDALGQCVEHVSLGIDAGLADKPA